MNVRELIEQLRRVADKEEEVFLAQDAEGNGFKHLASLTVAPYTYFGLSTPSSQQPAHRGASPMVVVFWPEG